MARGANQTPPISKTVIIVVVLGCLLAAYLFVKG